ncbi:NADPH--cytochrome P450 reductase [Mycolicibacterium cyprinidarum]|uniref:Bifunctional cytochrome P450/NADPH--P450 reductase n=1 Tax=Mycolicibacterium cyprinidarum TaxID=2860311 RepID=A0ABQ4V9P1_9MYCO|nr:NADPH--cytochrome P450 reductase [Mycolicibacterium sp. NGTWS0302]GJF12726.1 NADPH--cytochrome P450 reductase [Mycolicibacterium sp. NGTWSNA01]GJF20106.1 NADPH--cytochrome P450 reductase [Mycolicibacterium sp. NGTWS1803]
MLPGMADYAPSLPPELDDVPTVVGALPTAEDLVGRPYALPVDILGELHGPLFYADHSGARKLYACSLALVEELCDDSRFDKNLTKPLAQVRALAGDGLFTAYHGEPNWQKAHDVLLPGFSYAGLRNYHGAMLDINCQLIDRWDASVGRQTVDVSDDLQKLAMDTVALAGFGERFKSFDYDGLAPIPKSFTAAFDALGVPEKATEFETELANLHGYFDDLVARRRVGSAGETDDLLYAMLACDSAGEPVLDQQNIRNQIMTFLIAGQLTTSELMPNALYNLVHHPAVLTRVRAEVDEVFGPEDDYLPTYDDIGKLTYLRQVLYETLRLSPPVLNFDRMALSDTVICGKYPVKRGEALTVLTGALHRQPEWGDNVELFDPDRFEPSRAAARPTGLFKPFGTGERSCIGRQFAVHEATMAMARLVHRYRLVDSQHYVLQWDSQLSRRPIGFRLELIRRTPADRHRATTVETATSTGGPSHAVSPIRAGTTLAVLHGSNLGTCRALAKQLAEEATDMGCATTVGPLDDAAGSLPKADVILIVASSYNGQPTDDAQAFFGWLLGADAVVAGAPYFAVLGVGDHNWADTYQAVPKRIEERLTELGGQCLVPRASADTSGDLTGTLEEFSGSLWMALSEHFGDPDAAPVTDTNAPLYDLHTIEGPVTAAIDARFEVIPMTVQENTELVSDNLAFGHAKRFVRVALPDGIGYQTGDHLTVLADNPPDLVEAVLEALDIDPELRLAINPRRTSRRLIALDREVSARELLTHFVELRKPATRTQLLRLAAANPCQPERQCLEELAAASEPGVLSPLECLAKFPACDLSGAELLELLEPMTPRHYSIASSSRLSPHAVALVIGVLDAPSRSGQGLFKGVASNHLAAIGAGARIRARVDPARQAFRAGADPEKNVILVSAGTGVAPFRGFLGDRLAAKQEGTPFSPALCFFGVRDPDVDYIFREQFTEAESLGIVQMRPAFSRAPQNGVRYVQDRIAAEADEVWALLGDPAKDTHVFVCGDGARMAPAVRRAFLDIYCARNGSDESQAQDWLTTLVETDHYVEDVWAG